MSTRRKDGKSQVYCFGDFHQYPIVELIRKGNGLPAEIWWQCGRMVELDTYGADGRLESAEKLTRAEYEARLAGDGLVGVSEVDG